MIKKVEHLCKEYLLSKENHDLYQPWKDIAYCIHGRIEYEILRLYEEDPLQTLNEFCIQKSKSYRSGLCVNINNISKEFWIPNYFIESINKWRENFEIFDHDEFNAVWGSCIDSLEISNLVNRVLYNRDENRVLIGDKFDLFLNNSSWRSDAKKYSILLVEDILKRDKKNYVDSYSDSVNYVAKLYLNQMI